MDERGSFSLPDLLRKCADALRKEGSLGSSLAGGLGAKSLGANLGAKAVMPSIPPPKPGGGMLSTATIPNPTGSRMSPTPPAALKPTAPIKPPQGVKA